MSISVIIFTVFTATSTISAKDAATPEGRAGKLRIARTIVINPEGGRYEDPKLSPDGSKVVFQGQKGGLFIRNVDGTGPITTVLPPEKGTNQYIWSPDSKSIAYERSRLEGGRRWIDIIIFQANTKEITLFEEKIPPFRFTSWKREGLEVKRGLLHQKNKEREPIKAMNKIVDISTRELKQSDEPIVYHHQVDLRNVIIVEDANGNVLSETPGYILPIMSPIKDKFLATRGHTYVLNLSGDVLADLGDSDRARWSADGRLVVYEISEWGGWHNQARVASEIYIVNADGTGKNQLTNTPDIIEVEPHWSENNLKITYYDYATETIYVAELEFIG